ncbi:MAG: hypothetical protein A2Z18_08010 [Armatimonadetes bacterium RBG_16_58_9]|nr:MAG: hypothetical protein A2Z18_08010 [Armatimonadetes bacterium RBG_16_58_9]
MKVCVIGLGYIGLPTATLAAVAGHEVTGVDTNPAVVESLSNAVSHIHEPGLAELLTRAVVQGRLKAQRDVVEADVFIVAVPTPITCDKTADLEYVTQAAHSVVGHLSEGSLFIIESTIPPGCTEDVVIPILEESHLKAGEDFHVAHCPERVLPGRLLHELVHNDRVIGAIDPKSAERARLFYASFVQGDIITTGLKEAELTKLIENAYRDVGIAFANEVAAVCDRLGVDVWDVIKMANRHPRVSILNPGPGVGGHCIAVDPWFLVEACPEDTPLITTARAVNDHRPERIVEIVEEHLSRAGVTNPVIASLGLTYKADVSDARCSPAIEIVARLKKKGFDVRVCDPLAGGESPYECVTVDQAIDGADALLLLVEHEEYVALDVEAMRRRMRTPIVIDTKGVWRNGKSETKRTFRVADDSSSLVADYADQISA